MLKEFLKKHQLKEGDIVEAREGKVFFEGTIVPSVDEKILTLKLNTGYNAGIKITPNLKIKKIGSGKSVGKAMQVKFEEKKGLPTVSIIQIGGTIAARVDYRTGAVYTTYTPEDLITLVPELAEMANIKTKLLSNMFSEDMRFDHYKAIAKEIEKEAKNGVKGIILPHGTDTMAYTSAALAFILEGINIPVILVGSQRSTDRGSTDAIMNLICAMEFIAKTDFVGVGICMHGNNQDKDCVILPPCKTRKMHTSRRDAFRAINDTPIAKIGFKTRKIEFFKEYQKKMQGRKLKVLEGMNKKVALQKIYPNLMHEEIAFFREHGYKGVVLEGTGLGQAPVGMPNELCGENLKIMSEIKKLIKSGCVIVMTTQCLYGAVQMHVYSNAVDLVNLGVISGKDMLPETAFIKLAWLLGNFDREKAIELMPKNLRGEILEKTLIQKPEKYGEDKCQC